MRLRTDSGICVVQKKCDGGAVPFVILSYSIFDSHLYKALLKHIFVPSVMYVVDQTAKSLLLRKIFEAQVCVVYCTV